MECYDTCQNTQDVILSSRTSQMHLDKPNIDDVQDEVDILKTYKIKHSIMLNGVPVFVYADTWTEFAQKCAALYTGAPIHPQQVKTEKHRFYDYAENWFTIFKEPNVQTCTRQKYRQSLKKLYKELGDMYIEDLTVDVVQNFFNGLSGCKATKEEPKKILNMILERAVEDDILKKNPLNSSLFCLTGASSQPTKVYSVEEMRYIVSHIPDVKNQIDRMYITLQALTPLRLQEVLGLKWEDVNMDAMELYVRRAVTHPYRGKPEIKETKTEASRRKIPLSKQAVPYLIPGDPDEFVLGGKEPLTYRATVKMYERIAKDMNFDGRITPRRFRTTVLSDIYAETKDIKLTQQMAGHTTAAMTLKHYVKGREINERGHEVLDNIYC